MPGEEEEGRGTNITATQLQKKPSKNVTPSTSTTTTTTTSTGSSLTRKNSSGLLEQNRRKGSSGSSSTGGGGGGSGSGKSRATIAAEEEELRAKAKVADAIAKQLSLSSNKSGSFDSERSHHHHHHHKQAPGSGHHHRHHHHHQHESSSASPPALIDLHSRPLQQQQQHGPNRSLLQRAPSQPPPLPPPLLPIIAKGTLDRGRSVGEIEDGEQDLASSSDEESRRELELEFAGVDVEILELDECDSNFPHGEIIKTRAEPEDYTSVGPGDDELLQGIDGQLLRGPDGKLLSARAPPRPDGAAVAIEGDEEGDEEKPPPGPPGPKEPTLKEKVLFYITAFFILLAVFSLFAFLFLVPFVIDPAFSTIFKEFDPEPTICFTEQVVNLTGSSNCTWTSCREGCTKEIFNCTQILVKYRIRSGDAGHLRSKRSPIEPDGVVRWKNHSSKSSYYNYQTNSGGSNSNSVYSDYYNNYQQRTATIDRNIHRKKKHKTNSVTLALPLQSSNSRDLRPSPGSSGSAGGSGSIYGAASLFSGSESDQPGWFHRAHLFPNVRGCGYPPKVNCTRFIAAYAHVGRNFSCYYSKVDPKLVVTTFNMKRLLFELVLSMAIPIPCFVISTIYIVFAYFKIYAPAQAAANEARRVARAAAAAAAATAAEGGEGEAATAAASNADVTALDANTSSCQTATALQTANGSTNPLTTTTNNNIAPIPRLLPGDDGEDDHEHGDQETDDRAHIIQRPQPALRLPTTSTSTATATMAAVASAFMSKARQAPPPVQPQVVIQMSDMPVVTVAPTPAPRPSLRKSLQTSTSTSTSVASGASTSASASASVVTVDQSISSASAGDEQLLLPSRQFPATSVSSAARAPERNGPTNPAAKNKGNKNDQPQSQPSNRFQRNNNKPTPSTSTNPRATSSSRIPRAIRPISTTSTLASVHHSVINIIPPTPPAFTAVSASSPIPVPVPGSSNEPSTSRSLTNLGSKFLEPGFLPARTSKSLPPIESPLSLRNTGPNAKTSHFPTPSLPLIQHRQNRHSHSQSTATFIDPTLSSSSGGGLPALAVNSNEEGQAQKKKKKTEISSRR